MRTFPTDTSTKIIKEIADGLGKPTAQENRALDFNDHRASVVLLLLGSGALGSVLADQVCVVLTKRSARVRQPGDLCCPGGGIHPRTDAVLAGLWRGIGNLMSWSDKKPFWPPGSPAQTGYLRRLYATGLREAFEEIRLNPFLVRPLGLLPVQSLVMYGRTIHPVVGWLRGQQRLRPNWEVDRVTYLPLAALLNPDHYVQVAFQAESGQMQPPSAVQSRTFPGFLVDTKTKADVLWGATFRIVMDLLKQVFDFCPPDSGTLPLVYRTMPAHYLEPTQKGAL